MVNSACVQSFANGLDLRVTRNFPGTRAELEKCDQSWPDGVTHHGQPPQTLLERLIELFSESREART